MKSIRLDAIVEFDVLRFEVGDRLAYEEYGEYEDSVHTLILTDKGKAVALDAITEVIDELHDPQEQMDLANVRVLEPAWGIAVRAVGECSECPHASGFEHDAEAEGASSILSRSLPAILAECRTRLDALRSEKRAATFPPDSTLEEIARAAAEEASKLRHVRFLGLFRQTVWVPYGVSTDDWESTTELVGLFTLADVARAIGGPS